MNRKTKIFYLMSFLGVAVLLSGCTSFFEKKSSEDETTEIVKVTEMTTDKTSYEAGEDIVVTYDIVEELGENAWVGIVPAGTNHSEEEADIVDTDYEYLGESKIGAKNLVAPSKKGDYEVRIYSSDTTGAEELGYTSFIVTTDSVSIELDELEYAPQATITVTFFGAEGLDSTAWVGVIPSDIEHGSEAINDEHDISYKYLNGEASGTVNLVAPSVAGAYDVRLNRSDSTTGAKELTYVSFMVVE